MIKRYNEFINEKLSSWDVEIPENFEELKSVGIYLNTDTGKIYNAILEDDWVNGFGLDFSEYEDGFSLSKEDQELVDKYYRSCEEVVKDKINYDFIDSAYELCVSEGVFDNYYTLGILVKMVDTTLLKYTALNSGEEYEYEKFFGNDLKEIESASDFNYYLLFIGDGNKDVITHKVISRIENLLKEMYPDLSINRRSKGEPKFF
jgi:hypothetical protein